MGIAQDNNLKYRVALGQVPGWRIFRKFGMNDNVVSSQTQEMWPLGTARVWPSAAGTVSTVSSSTDDDADPSEDVTLDGTTPVVGTKSFLRVNRAYILTAGSGEINAGNITGSIGGNAQYYIEATQGQTHQTHYTVPRAHSVLVDQYRMNVGRMGGSTDLHVLGQARLNGGVNDEGWRSLTDIFIWNGGGWANDSGATLVPEKTDIRQVIKSTTTTQASAVIAGFLITNDSYGI
jgi:hypothetical protein